MPDDDGAEGAAKLVSMDDLKSMEASLRSAMETQMETFMKMFSDRFPTAPSVIPTLEVKDKGELEEGDALALPSSTTPLNGDNLNTIKTPSASPRGTSGGVSYNNVAPPFRSPDIPVPHPQINNRGDPPKFNVEDFSTWQFEFRSHVCSASNELSRIIIEGYNPYNPNKLTRREEVDLCPHTSLNHVQGNGVELVINLFSSSQPVGVVRLVTFQDDSPKFIGGTANMRAKLKLPCTKILIIKLGWITPSAVSYTHLRAHET